MPTTSCDDCGKEISVHAEQCPNCGSPAKHALKSWQRQVEEAAKANKAAEAEDVILLTDNEVTVTKNRFVTPERTYSMRNITSIDVGRGTNIPFLIGCLLITLCLAGGEVLFYYDMLIVGVGCFAYAHRCSTHTIRLTTTAGEVTALKSKDKQQIENIATALNTAISQH
jgi:ribosomal protein L37E